MNKRRFAMPALCSVGLHAGLVLMPLTDVARPRPAETPAVIPVVQPPDDATEAIVPIDADPGAEPSPGPRRGVAVPSGEELEPSGPAGPFTVPLQPPAPGERGLRFLPGIPGVPEGAMDGLPHARIESGPIDYTRLDRTPDARVRPAPAYPAGARREGLEGSVVIEFAVDAGGTVRSARIVSSTAPVFEEPALAAVSRWRFEPGTRKGIPVPFRMRQVLLFSLRE